MIKSVIKNKMYLLVKGRVYDGDDNDYDDDNIILIMMMIKL